MTREQNYVFNWCFIGAGKLAGGVAREITRSGRHRVVSVYARRPERCRAFAQPYGALPCASAAEAITASGVDAVYIVTPHSTHYEYAKLALELGKPVLCEKPFTTDAKQAEELIRLARSKGLYIAEAMWTWFAPVANRVKSWLDSGEFGTLREVKLTYHAAIKNGAGRLTDPNRAGGALLDIGVYPITYLYRLFGTPVKVECTGELENGVDLREDVVMAFSNGGRYAASISMADWKGLERMSIKGTQASLSVLFYHNAGRVKLKRKQGRSEVFKGDGSMLNEFDLAAGEIREGLTESRYVPHRSTLDVMCILDECRRQLGLVYPFER